MTLPLPLTRKVYFYIASAWVDYTAYVLYLPATQAMWGMGSNSPVDRMAQTGSFNFSLNNASGIFSPDGSSAVSGWKKGIPIKIVFKYDGEEWIRFRGAVDNITVDPGLRGNRSVTVTVLDWLDYAAKYPLNTPAVEQNKPTDYAIDAITMALPIQPQSKVMDNGISYYPTIFDQANINTRAYSEYAKQAISEPGYFHLNKDRYNGEQVVFEALDYRNGLVPVKTVRSTTGTNFLLAEDDSFLLMEDGTKLATNEATAADVFIDNTMINMEIEYGAGMINKIPVSAYPKRVDTVTTKVYQLETPIPFASGETKTFKTPFYDPNSKRPVAALSPGTDLYTKSLLHFDGLPNQNVIYDETGKIWTSVANDVSLVTNIVKFGTASGYFDGSTSYITTPSSDDFNFGTGDFTIDWWEYRFANTSGLPTTSRDYSASFPSFLLGSSNGVSLLIYMSSAGASYDIANGKTLGAITLNTWNHFAVSRSGNNFYAFKNGALTDSWTSSATLNPSTATFSIGRHSTNYLSACIDEFRVTKGFARYTTTFTPPTEASQLTGTFFSAFTTAAGGGTELTGSFTFNTTYYGSNALHTITNGSANNGYLYSLSIYSYLVQSDAPIVSDQESSASYLEYGYQIQNFNQPYQQNLLIGVSEAKKILEYNKTPRTELHKVTMNATRSELLTRAFLEVDVGDLVKIKEDQSGINGLYWVQGVEFTVGPGMDGVIVFFSWTLQRAYKLGNGLTLMACEFDAASTDAINYGYIPLLTVDKTIYRAFSVWVYVDVAPANNVAGSILSFHSDDTGPLIYYVSNGTNVFLKFYNTDFTLVGAWSDNSSFSVAAWHHIFIYYDASNVNNDPVFYIDGALRTITETSTPSGTIKSEVGNELVVGNIKTATLDYGTYPFDGKIKDPRVYDVNAIGPTTPAALAAAINAEGAGGSANTTGMIFQGLAIRTAELAAFTDLTLTSETKLLDTYLGYVGTANGTPITRTI